MALGLLLIKRAGNCFSLDALTEEPEARELVEESVQSAERARLLRPCMAELLEDYRGPRPSGGQGNWNGSGSAAVPVGSSGPGRRPVSP